MSKTHSEPDGYVATKQSKGERPLSSSLPVSVPVSVCASVFIVYVRDL